MEGYSAHRDCGQDYVLSLAYEVMGHSSRTEGLIPCPVRAFIATSGSHYYSMVAKLDLFNMREVS